MEEGYVHKFEVIILTSNKDEEDVRRRLEKTIANWLDNVCFLTEKPEICKDVIIIK